MAFTSDNVLVFLAVLDRGSFSAAARALSRVPSAVSMAIAQLEAELDMPLFDRSGREPRPTAAARALEPQARALAAQLQQLNTQALALTQGLEERLTLAIAPELLAARWHGPLATLAQDYPSRRNIRCWRRARRVRALQACARNTWPARARSSWPGATWGRPMRASSTRATIGAPTATWPRWA